MGDVGQASMRRAAPTVQRHVTGIVRNARRPSQRAGRQTSRRTWSCSSSCWEVPAQIMLRIKKHNKFKLLISSGEANYWWKRRRAIGCTPLRTIGTNWWNSIMYISPTWAGGAPWRRFATGTIGLQWKLTYADTVRTAWHANCSQQYSGEPKLWEVTCLPPLRARHGLWIAPLHWPPGMGSGPVFSSWWTTSQGM